MGAHLFDLQSDCFDYAFNVLVHLSVGEAQDGVAFALHPFVPRSIALGRYVMAVAVEFDHQFEFSAQEIGVVRPDWHLAAELCALPTAGEVLP